MTTVASLVRVLHDIDAVKGRVCGCCEFNRHLPGSLGNGRPVTCRKGYGPAGPYDGCDDWQPRRVPKAAKTHPRPSNESGGAF